VSLDRCSYLPYYSRSDFINYFSSGASFSKLLSLPKIALLHVVLVYITVKNVYNDNKSPLPLTDPHDAVLHAYCVIHRCRWSV